MSSPAFLPSRRQFLAASAGLAATALSTRLPAWGAGPAASAFPKGTADHCIFLWLGGGASHLDTWDPKQVGDGKKKPGSAYPAIDTAIPGVQVCEHLARCAPILDRFALLRTVHHDVIDEHAAATNRLHTGRPTSGTVVYPSIGSIVAHQRGPAGPGIPPYVVIGYPNLTRGPGFLGARHGYVYLTDTEAGPSGLTRPEGLTTDRRQRREQLLGTLRRGYAARTPGDQAVADYDAAIDESFRLTGGDFMRAFALEQEPGSLRQAYGSEFGQRCLLARRLVQTGVRFIEVSFNLNFINGTGWDTHNDGQRNQHLLIRDLDQSLATLVRDLEQHRLLERTLVVVATEFGRPPEFDNGGGRGHWSKAFSVVLAGGGLRTGQAVGTTDELGRRILEHPVSVPDLHATIHCALGINPARYLRDENDRPVPITDRGEPVRRLFATA
ncbi:MAG: hypothetical protein RJA22_2366 [Verrucomicrobiota bacterium]|jgi:hypothetical protein